MSITTLDQVIAGMQPPVSFTKSPTGALVAGRPNSTFIGGGMPGAAVAPTCGLAGEALISYAGQLPYKNPPAGKNAYLARFTGQATIAGVLILCDRLWHNSGLDLTSTLEQAINSVPFPPRDANGAAAGEQIMVGLEIMTATGAGTPSLAMNYTNSVGVAGRVGDGILAGVASSAARTFYPLGLAAGDTGVRRIEGFTLSASWTSGIASLVAYREIARMEVGSNIGSSLDALTGGLPRLYDNSVPFLLFVPSTTTSSNISGSMAVTWG